MTSAFTFNIRSHHPRPWWAGWTRVVFDCPVTPPCRIDVAPNGTAWGISSCRRHQPKRGPVRAEPVRKATDEDVQEFLDVLRERPAVEAEVEKARRRGGR